VLVGRVANLLRFGDVKARRASQSSIVFNQHQNKLVMELELESPPRACAAVTFKRGRIPRQSDELAPQYKNQSR